MSKNPNPAGNPEWKKGVSGNPNGRPKGTPNRSTMKIKDAYADLINNNLDRIQGWLDDVASDDPKSALDFLIKLSPFVVPRKTETDMTLESPLKIIVPAPTLPAHEPPKSLN